MGARSFVCMILVALCSGGAIADWSPQDAGMPARPSTEPPPPLQCPSGRAGRITLLGRHITGLGSTVIVTAMESGPGIHVAHFELSQEAAKQAGLEIGKMICLP